MDSEVVTSPFLDQLPLGLVVNNTWQRHYVLRELTSGDVGKIHDADLVRKAPVEWMGRIVALSLESLAEEPVYEPYRKSEYTKLPDILFSLPMSDASYLMVASHVFSYGPTIEAMRFTCPACRQSSVRKVDLTMLTVDRATEPVSKLDIEVPKGFTYRGEYEGARGRVYKRFVFKVPTLQEFIKYQERFSKAVQAGDVNSYILLASLVDVYDEQGQTMSPEVRSMLGVRIDQAQHHTLRGEAVA